MGFKLENTVDLTEKAPKKEGLQKLLQQEITLFGKSFGSKKKEDLYTELAVLLKAGIPLREGLSLIADNQKKEKMQQFYSAMLDDLVAGTSLSEVFEQREEFSEYEYYSIKIGEETGTLPKVCEELGNYFARKNEQRRALTNALTYPIIILITAILVVIFMLRMVVPMFEDIFRQNQVELPGITRMIIAASNGIRDYGGLILLLILALFLSRKYLLKGEGFQIKRDFFLLKIPYLGNFLKAVYLAQFTQAVALLTSSKVPVLNSIQLVRKMIKFHPLQQALAAVEVGVLQGKPLNESLKGSKMFDAKMVSLVKVAEETNQTEFIFERLNQQYAIEVQQKSKLLSTIMEPLIIVVIGIFVGIILVSMYLPMFKLSSVLG